MDTESGQLSLPARRSLILAFAVGVAASAALYIMTCVIGVLVYGTSEFLVYGFIFCGFPALAWMFGHLSGRIVARHTGRSRAEVKALLAMPLWYCVYYLWFFREPIWEDDLCLVFDWAIQGAILVVPLWFFTFLGCRGSRRRATPDPRFCLQCSYDLTGNSSGICPECGTPIAEDVRQALIGRGPEPPQE